jgi:phosphate:Na+ symporter
LSILFIGLGFLREVVPLVPQESSFLKDIASYYSNYGFLSLLVFFVFGMLLTIIFQSSSATIALTFVLAIDGWIPFPMAAAMVLGENLGTTITALIASTVANRSGKRVAIIHLLFNLFGIAWGIILLKPVLNLIDLVMLGLEMESPFLNTDSIPIALSIFHSGFNLINMIILINFIPRIITLSEKIFPRAASEEIYRLTFIDSRVLSTSELSLVQARKEIAVMARRTAEMFDMVPDLLIKKRPKEYEYLVERIKKYEDIIDRMELEIARYLTKLSEGKLSDRGSNQSRAMLKIIDDIETIADICYKMSLVIENKNKNNLYFIQELRDNVNAEFTYTKDALANMVEQLSKSYSDVDCDKAKEIELAMHELREKLRQNHIANIKKEKYSYQTGVIYNDILRLTERIGEISLSICRSIASIN